MKKTIIQSSALAIICLLAVSSKSIAQPQNTCAGHGGVVHQASDSKGNTFTQCADGKTSTTSGGQLRRRKK